MSRTLNKRHGFKIVDLPDQPSNLSGEHIPGKKQPQPLMRRRDIANFAKFADSQRPEHLRTSSLPTCTARIAILPKRIIRVFVIITNAQTITQWFFPRVHLGSKTSCNPARDENECSWTPANKTSALVIYKYKQIVTRTSDS